jgi:TRAP-type mannitol/chloroaromatic compound transport system permease small subunit
MAMVLVIGFDVAMRYLFQSGSVALQELEWHLFALIFLLGAAYTFKHDEHVRLDILYHSRWMDARKRAWVDLLGGLFILLPFCVLIISTSFPFVSNSFHMAEGSPDPGGLPYRFILKAAIPLGFALLLLQGVAHMLRSAMVLWGYQDSAAEDKT